MSRILSGKGESPSLGSIMTNGLGSPVVDEFMQWISITSVGAAIRMLAEIGAALNGGVSCRATLRALLGA